MLFPYLQFDGQCEEALQLYTRAFGGQCVHMSKYGAHAPIPALKEKIMHAEVALGDIGYLSAADAPQPTEAGPAISIMIRTTEPRMRAGWAVLAEEGTVIAQLEPFEIEGGGLMGTIRDKYGFTWIFTQGE